jgi:hypothetical protein
MTLSLIFSAVSLILCCFFFIFFRSYIHRRTTREDIIASYREEVNKLIVDLNAITDRDITLVEERISSLKKILEETDKRLAVYVREFERRKHSESLYTNLAQVSNKTIIGGNAPEKPVPEPDIKGPAVQPPLFSEPTEPDARPFKEQVALLAASGLSNSKIAARLSVSESEVDLTLSLLNRKK